MYESFFGMEHTPFVRDVPPEKLFESNAFRETLAVSAYVADRQMFAVVTAEFRVWKVNAYPPVPLFGTSKRGLHHPLSVRLKTDPKVVL